MVCLWHLIALSQSSRITGNVHCTYLCDCGATTQQDFFLCFKMDMLWGYGLLYNMSNGHYLSIYLFFVINLRKGSFLYFFLDIEKLQFHYSKILSIRVLWYYYFVSSTIVSRQDRLSCIKQLGDKIEQRKLLLLRDEVNHTLQLIHKQGFLIYCHK